MISRTHPSQKMGDSRRQRQGNGRAKGSGVLTALNHAEFCVALILQERLFSLLSSLLDQGMSPPEALKQAFISADEEFLKRAKVGAAQLPPYTHDHRGRQWAIASRVPPTHGPCLGGLEATTWGHELGCFLTVTTGSLYRGRDSGTEARSRRPS
jgi:hypothetical protein